MEKTSATPVSSVSTLLTAGSKLLKEAAVDTNWLIRDGNKKYIIDAVSVSGGRPDFTVGEESELTLLFHENGHQVRYEEFKKTFGEVPISGRVVYGLNESSEPYFTVSQKPNETTNRNYLWKIQPPTRLKGIDGFWAVPLSIEDETTLVGGGEKITVELFVISPLTYGNRTVVTNQYEVSF